MLRFKFSRARWRLIKKWARSHGDRTMIAAGGRRLYVVAPGSYGMLVLVDQGAKVELPSVNLNEMPPALLDIDADVSLTVEADGCRLAWTANAMRVVSTQKAPPMEGALQGALERQLRPNQWIGFDPRRPAEVITAFVPKRDQNTVSSIVMPGGVVAWWYRREWIYIQMPRELDDVQQDWRTVAELTGVLNKEVKQ